jgi:hypothetical protein
VGGGRGGVLVMVVLVVVLDGVQWKKGLNVNKPERQKQAACGERSQVYSSGPLSDYRPCRACRGVRTAAMGAIWHEGELHKLTCRGRCWQCAQ